MTFEELSESTENISMLLNELWFYKSVVQFSGYKLRNKLLQTNYSIYCLHSIPFGMLRVSVEEINVTRGMLTGVKLPAKLLYSQHLLWQFRSLPRASRQLLSLTQDYTIITVNLFSL